MAMSERSESIRPDARRVGMSRRHVLALVVCGAGGLAASNVGASMAQAAASGRLEAAIRQVTGGAIVTAGRVKLELPPLSENGNSVPCAVTVASPMTPADHVRAIHVFNSKNPQSNVISSRLGPRAGRAQLATRIRLADSQTVVAIAHMSDGTFWSDSVDVIVTIGACLEDPL